MSLIVPGEVLKDVTDYFDDEEKAWRWLKTPNLQLSNESPGEYCTSHYGGDQKVLELLNRMRHGMTA